MKQVLFGVAQFSGDNMRQEICQESTADGLLPYLNAIIPDHKRHIVFIDGILPNNSQEIEIKCRTIVQTKRKSY